MSQPDQLDKAALEARKFSISDDELAGMKEDNMSLVDIKTVLVNRAINEAGFQRYQLFLFFLCGYGYLIDLMFAQAFGLILAPLQQELNISTERIGDLSSAFSAGLCVGAFFWGILLDVAGRRWSFNLTCLFCGVFGLLIGAPSNYGAICFLTAMCGFGLGGNIPVDASLLLEFLPSSKRWLLVLLSVFQPIGVLIASLIAWGFIPNYSCDPDLLSCRAVPDGEPCCTMDSNMGWRYLLFTLGAITLACFALRFFVFPFQESPKYLLSRGRDDEALQSLRNIAKFNKQELRLTEDDFESIRERSISENGERTVDAAKRVSRWSFIHLKLLFSDRRLAITTLLIFGVYMADYFGFSVAGNFLPLILADKGAARDTSTYETYRNYIIIYVCGIPGVLIGAAIVEVPRIGRKWSMVVSSALMGVSLFLYAVIDSQAANIAFNALEYFFQSLFNAVLYGYAPEVFPTAVRGSAVGTASTLGRLVSIVSPLIAAHLYANSGTNSVLYLAGGVTFGATIASLFLPETRGKNVM